MTLQVGLPHPCYIAAKSILVYRHQNSIEGGHALLFVELDDLVHVREINTHTAKGRRKISLTWTSAAGAPLGEEAVEHTSRLEPPENGTIESQLQCQPEHHRQ
jgi:hypothetical protein